MAAPLFKFGLISDIQWADIPDGASFHGVPRYYRDALASARRAVVAFTAARVHFALHLGDIVDFHNTRHGSSQAALEAAVETFEALGAPVLHCIGNHCLYNAPRPVLNALLGIDAHRDAEPPAPRPGSASDTAAGPPAAGQHSYFAFDPPVEGPGYRVLVLDGYDVSLLGWPPGHPAHEAAAATLAARNPNADWNSGAGLQGLDRRFVKFGGAAGPAQIAWLRGQLAACRSSGLRALLACHLCLHPATCPPTCLLWNFQEVLDLCAEFGDVVAATLAGHAHADGYFRDPGTGIHHKVCPGVLETPPGSDCYAIVSVWADRIEVKGRGVFRGGKWAVGAPGEGAGVVAAV